MVSLVLAALSGTLAIQDTLPRPLRTSTVGAGVEFWAPHADAIPILTFKAGWYRERDFGVEVGLGGLSEPVLIPEAGLTYQIRAGGSWIVVRGGLSPMAYPFGAVFGGYGGAGVILKAGNAGLRLDLTRRLLREVGGIWSIGVAVTSPPDSRMHRATSRVRE